MKSRNIITLVCVIVTVIIGGMAANPWVYRVTVGKFILSSILGLIGFFAVGVLMIVYTVLIGKTQKKQSLR
jgi:hypothetical protein